MAIPFVDLQAQQAQVVDEILPEIESVLRQGNFILGDPVSQFEAEFAEYIGSDYAVGLDSGLSALKLALAALGIGPGDEVIVPVNTFIATAAAVSFLGARPVFVEMDEDTNNIDVTRIEAAINERTKAIMPVHLYGSPVDMDPVMAVANRYNLYVVEDAAQAHGAMYKGKRVGSIGHAGAFSFYPAKNLGAAGDAGALVTNDPDVAERVKGMRNVGQVERYIHSLPPYNHRMDTLHAVVLTAKLKRLDGWNASRDHLAGLYIENLPQSIIAPQRIDYGTQVWHLFVVRAERRDDLRAALQTEGIGTGIHYPVPLHLQPYYADLGYQRGDFPVAEMVADEIVSLPMYAEMAESDVRLVCERLSEFVLTANPT
ncbi:MAG: DegT/DnrJ/EryC1/StrS family aminotransferase [Anaerolineae bacterium]|nr:DegT/DnrJ/EryC1/StrS family aminotransferase [Anaerolineae bacterium]